MIRRGAHKSVQALEAGIRARVENWNDNPRPFAWTKTAEEILESLARYLQKISPAADGKTKGFMAKSSNAGLLVVVRWIKAGGRGIGRGLR